MTQYLPIRTLKHNVVLARGPGEEKVVLKSVMKENVQACTLLKREANLLQMLQCEWIVRAIDTCEDDREYTLVLEYLGR